MAITSVLSSERQAAFGAWPPALRNSQLLGVFGEQMAREVFVNRKVPTGMRQ